MLPIEIVMRKKKICKSGKHFRLYITKSFLITRIVRLDCVYSLKFIKDKKTLLVLEDKTLKKIGDRYYFTIPKRFIDNETLGIKILYKIILIPTRRIENAA